MSDKRPILVHDNITLARPIAVELANSGIEVDPSGIEDCFRRVGCRKAETLLVIAAAESKILPSLIRLVREFRLRRTAVKVLLLQLNPGASAETCDELDSVIAGRFHWPDELSEIVAQVKVLNERQEDTTADTDSLAAQLMATTPSLMPLARRLEIVAKHAVPVLLTGETGTGKTFLARLIHNYSPRRAQPFLAVPCGAQPVTLFESVFFGHERGAFTGAHRSQQGKFAAAGSGTILLDEVDVLELEQQIALLRVIETGEYELVGGNRTHKSDARIIVASNRDLESAVDCGEFRQDLYYRLNVMAFRLPPLRERPSDIPPLAREIVARFATRFGKPPITISSEALGRLITNPWPGNIRQMENVLQQAVLVCRGEELTIHDLPNAEQQMPSETADHLKLNSPLSAPAAVNNADHSNGTLLRNRADFERALIRKTLEACKHNRSSAARELGISRVTLHKKINQYGLRNLTST